MKLKLRFAALGVAASLLLLFAFAPAASAAKKTTNTLTVTNETGTATTGQAITATFNISHFVQHDGAVWAEGTLTNIAINGVPQKVAPVPTEQQVQAINGTPIGTSSSAATTNAATGAATTAPAAADPTCSILTLTLGPLHLNLLGLVVDLNQVNLAITAVQAPGNLLGNLLCAVANLLNGPGGLNLTPITNLLNNILAAL